MEYVKFRKDHLDQIINACQAMVNYKHRALSRSNWLRFESDYMPKMIQALSENKFKVADVHNGIIPWIIDNICHSRTCIEGCKHSEGQPLADLDSIQESLRILRAASRGQKSYNLFCSQNTSYDNLFSQ